MSELGIVKWYSLARGYGFIRRKGNREEDGEDIFVHHSEVPDEPLTEGEHVSFEVVDGAKGLKAQNVRRAPADPLAPEDGAPPARRE